MSTSTEGLPESPDLAAMLFAEPPAVLDVPQSAWGFGGLHGGLALSLLARKMQGDLPEHPLRSITGHFHRPVRDTLMIESRVIRSGRSAGAVQATGSGPDGVCLTATALFGSDQSACDPVCAPAAPEVPGPHDLPSLDVADIKVPVLGHVDVRPIGSIHPYADADEPVMTAWMRVRGRDEPADPSSVIFFLDALPPSYTAVLPTPSRSVPTLEFSVHLSAVELVSPWLLVRSRTVKVTRGGWVTESIDAWDPDGRHLGVAQQLRLAVENR